GALVAAGGLAWNAGRCWLWLTPIDRTRTYPVHIVRLGRRMLRMAAQLGEREVYCVRDPEPHAARLMRLVGLTLRGTEPTRYVDGSTGEMEVWTWQAS